MRLNRAPDVLERARREHLRGLIAGDENPVGIEVVDPDDVAEASDPALFKLLPSVCGRHAHVPGRGDRRDRLAVRRDAQTVGASAELGTEAHQRGRAVERNTATASTSTSPTA